jgi:hypothetical protein
MPQCTRGSTQSTVSAANPSPEQNNPPGDYEEVNDNHRSNDPDRSATTGHTGHAFTWAKNNNLIKVTQLMAPPSYPSAIHWVQLSRQSFRGKCAPFGIKLFGELKLE